MSERGNDYSAERDLPPLVRRAADLAQRMRFGNSCAVPYGRLLAVLAAHAGDSRIGEMGTGCGVGTAWMLSAASPDSRIVTIEKDAERAGAVREMFTDVSNVTVLAGDSLTLVDHAPFDLLFCDGGGKSEDQQVTVGMVRPGGMIVLDDLTTGWNAPDEVRRWWLENDELNAIEITIADDFAAILAVRR